MKVAGLILSSLCSHTVQYGYTSVGNLCFCSFNKGSITVEYEIVIIFSPLVLCSASQERKANKRQKELESLNFLILEKYYNVTTVQVILNHILLLTTVKY